MHGSQAPTKPYDNDELTRTYQLCDDVLHGVITPTEFLKRAGVSGTNRYLIKRNIPKKHHIDPITVLSQSSRGHTTFNVDFLHRVLESKHLPMIDIFLQLDIVPMSLSTNPPDDLRRRYVRAAFEDCDETQLAQKFVAFTSGKLDSLHIRSEEAVRVLIERGSVEEENHARLRPFFESLNRYIEPQRTREVLKSLTEVIAREVNNPINALTIIDSLNCENPEPISLSSIASILKNMNNFPTELISHDRELIDDVLFAHMIRKIQRLSKRDSDMMYGYRYEWSTIEKNLGIFDGILPHMLEATPKTAAAISTLRFLQHIYTPHGEAPHEVVDHEPVKRFVAHLHKSGAEFSPEFCRAVEGVIDRLRTTHHFNSVLTFCALTTPTVYGDTYFDLIAEDMHICHAFGRLFIDITRESGFDLPDSVNDALAHDDRWALIALQEGYSPQGFIEKIAKECGPVTYYELIKLQLDLYMSRNVPTPEGQIRLSKSEIFELAVRFDEMNDCVEQDSSGAFHTARTVFGSSLRADEIAEKYLSGAYRRNLTPVLDQLLLLAGITPPARENSQYLPPVR